MWVKINLKNKNKEKKSIQYGEKRLIIITLNNSLNESNVLLTDNYFTKTKINKLLYKLFLFYSNIYDIIELLLPSH